MAGAQETLADPGADLNAVQRTAVDDRAAARARLRAIAEPVLLVLITAALGLYRIGDKSLWLDEAYSYASAINSPRIFLSLLLSRDLDSSAYFLALKPWLVFGSSEASLRSLSVVFGVIAVLATYAIGRRYGYGFAAGLLLAVSPFFVAYMQETRQYAMFVAWGALSTLAFLRYRERPGLLRAIVYVFFAGTMVYVHPMGVFVIAAHVLALGFDTYQTRHWRRLAIFIPVLIAWLPIVPFALNNSFKISYLPPLSADGVGNALLALGGGAVAAGGLLALIATGFRLDLFAAWLLLPIAGDIAVSLLVQPALVARYLIGVLPAAMLIAARNRALPVAVVIILSLAGTFSWYVDGRKDDWRSAAAWVTANVQPSDGIVFASDYGRIPFAYYGRVGDPIYPPFPWSEPYQTYGGDPNSLDGHPRIWFVRESQGLAPQELLDALKSYDVVDSRTFGVLEPTVELLVAP